MGNSSRSFRARSPMAGEHLLPLLRGGLSGGDFLGKAPTRPSVLGSINAKHQASAIVLDKEPAPAVRRKRLIDLGDELGLNLLTAEGWQELTRQDGAR